MGKMSDMAQIIEELRTAADTVAEAAGWLALQLGGTPKEEPAPTLEQVRAVLADKSRQGLTAQVRELLQKYGAGKLSEVAPAHYGSLMRDAEVLEHAC